MQNTCRIKGRKRSRGGGEPDGTRKQMSFCPDKMPARLGLVLGLLRARMMRWGITLTREAAGTSETPFGCTGACCFDDRPDELMRYDAPHCRSWCVCLRVWVCVRAVGHNTFIPSLSKDAACTQSRPNKGFLTASIHHVRSDFHIWSRRRSSVIQVRFSRSVSSLAFGDNIW